MFETLLLGTRHGNEAMWLIYEENQKTPATSVRRYFSRFDDEFEDLRFEPARVRIAPATWDDRRVTAGLAIEAS